MEGNTLGNTLTRVAPAYWSLLLLQVLRQQRPTGRTVSARGWQPGQLLTL